MASNSIVNMFKVKELRNRLLFTLAVLAIYRLGCVLTIPGIDAQALIEVFENAANQNKGNAFANYMDFFVGGAFSNFSVFIELAGFSVTFSFAVFFLNKLPTWIFIPHLHFPYEISLLFLKNLHKNSP